MADVVQLDGTKPSPSRSTVASTPLDWLGTVNGLWLVRPTGGHKTSPSVSTPLCQSYVYIRTSKSQTASRKSSKLAEISPMTRVTAGVVRRPKGQSAVEMVT